MGAFRPVSVPSRRSVTGHEPVASALARCLGDANFLHAKSLFRVRLKKPSSRVRAAIRALAGESRGRMGFAAPEDAEDIYELPDREFPPVGGNLPELSEVRENIPERRVSFVKPDGHIASLHYFNISDGISCGYHDLTRKESRGGWGPALALTVFEDEHFTSHGSATTRMYGWRDMPNTRYLKSSRQTKSFPDGAVSHALAGRPGRKRCPGRESFPSALPMRKNVCIQEPIPSLPEPPRAWARPPRACSPHPAISS